MPAPTPPAHILFLDFDGVLHRYASGTFSKLPQFCDWLATQPHIGVVISSTWRLQYCFEELQEFFPPRVRHQVLGVTPDLSSKEGFIVRAAARSDEILAWLEKHPEVQHWVALDDEARLFPCQLDRVVLTEAGEGLSALHLREVEQRLQKN